MKALTVHQPWSYCIAIGIKPIENRPWFTTYRGPLAIHAGRRWDKHGGTDYRVLKVMEKWVHPARIYPGELDLAEFADLFHFGAVVAIAELVDCHRATECCEPWGDPDVGDAPTYHWVLTDVHPLAAPIPARGLQRLWNVELPQEVLM